MTQSTQRRVAFVFGVVFVIALLALAILFPYPTPFQYTVFRIVLALAAAGAAAMIPGFVEVNLSGWVRAGGALAVFVIVYFFVPAALVEEPGSPAAEPPAEEAPQAPGAGQTSSHPSPIDPPAEPVAFSEEIVLQEDDVAVAHGITLETGAIEVAPDRPAAVRLGASVTGGAAAAEAYPEGAVLRLERDGCDSLEVHVKDIRVDWPDGVSAEDIRKMGSMADEVAKRSVLLLVTGRCAEESPA